MEPVKEPPAEPAAPAAWVGYGDARLKSSVLTSVSAPTADRLSELVVLAEPVVADVSKDVDPFAPTMSITPALAAMLPVSVIAVLLERRKTCPPAAARLKLAGPASAVGSATPL